MAKHPDPISSHVLDTSTGLPAAGISITFAKLDPVSSQWIPICQKKANGDGRASAFLTWEEILPMTYRMRFDIQDYFKTSNVDTFYPYAEVVFQIKDPKAHYHIPLLLSPYGYSTYRGS
eukprot:02333.XXX_24899_24299_1 [CDS] Oithona nana genome sequencing.